MRRFVPSRIADWRYTASAALSIPGVDLSLPANQVGAWKPQREHFR
jgi:hypothetical protein